jgi:hypothetical protein
MFDALMDLKDNDDDEARLVVNILSDTNMDLRTRVWQWSVT